MSAGLQGEVECLTLLGRWDEALSQADALPTGAGRRERLHLAGVPQRVRAADRVGPRPHGPGDDGGILFVAYARAYDEAQVIFGTIPLVARLKLTTDGPAAAIALIELVATVEGTRFDPSYATNLPTSVRTAIAAGAPRLAAALVKASHL